MGIVLQLHRTLSLRRAIVQLGLVLCVAIVLIMLIDIQKTAKCFNASTIYSIIRLIHSQQVSNYSKREVLWSCEHLITLSIIYRIWAYEFSYTQKQHTHSSVRSEEQVRDWDVNIGIKCMVKRSMKDHCFWQALPDNECTGSVKEVGSWVRHVDGS